MYAVKVNMGHEFGLMWLTEAGLEAKVQEFDTYGIAKSHGDIWKGGHTIWKWNFSKEVYELCEP